MSRIFISYSTLDYELTLQVAAGLDSEGLPCFVAKRDLPLGLNWIEEVARNLKAAPVVVFLATANSVQSFQCQNELREANNRQTPIIPVVIDAAAVSDGFSLLVGSHQRLDASGEIGEWGPLLAAGLRRLLPSPAGPSGTAPSQAADTSTGFRGSEPKPQAVPTKRSKPALYLDFWTLFLERLHATHPDWSRANTPSSKNWTFIGSPFKGAMYRPLFRGPGRLGHDLYIDTGNEATSLAMFKELHAARELIEREYGFPLTWSEMVGKQACCISDDTPGSVEQVDRHEEYVAWLLDRGERMRSAVAAFKAGRGRKASGGYSVPEIEQLPGKIVTDLDGPKALAHTEDTPLFPGAHAVLDGVAAAAKLATGNAPEPVATPAPSESAPSPESEADDSPVEVEIPEPEPEVKRRFPSMSPSLANRGPLTREDLEFLKMDFKPAPNDWPNSVTVIRGLNGEKARSVHLRVKRPDGTPGNLVFCRVEAGGDNWIHKCGGTSFLPAFFTDMGTNQDEYTVEFPGEFKNGLYLVGSIPRGTYTYAWIANLAPGLIGDPMGRLVAEGTFTV